MKLMKTNRISGLGGFVLAIAVSVFYALNADTATCTGVSASPVVTPIHRGYAHLGDTNIQPEESFPNALGHRFEEYIAALREAADIWSVPVIDLYRESGLFPMNASYAKYFRRGCPTSADNPRPDNLHPNSEGHRRLAKVIAARLLTMPTDFKAAASR